MGSIERERIAALEAERARMGQAKAEAERDIVAGAAINEAAGRNAAENAATNERRRADMAESAARSASASVHAAYEEARDERTVAGNSSMLAIVAVIIAIAVVAVVGYFVWWQPSQVSTTNTVIEHTIKTAPSNQSAAPTINVAPPHVNVNVENPPPTTGQQNDGSGNTSNQSDGDTSGDNNSSGPGSGG